MDQDQDQGDKHTPGEWRIGHCASVVTGEPRDDSERYYGGQVVCESISNRADALLIVAAKQMLAACEAVEHWWLTQGMQMPGICGAPACIFAVREAIAVSRATGGDPPPDENGHIILTPAECRTKGHPHRTGDHCPVCDGGLSVCARCPEYEAGLDEPCRGREGKEGATP